MARIIFFVLLAAVIWYAWRQSQRRVGTDAGRPESTSRAIEAMVPCAVCGLNVPRSEARSDGGEGAERRFFCSDAHRQAAGG